MILLECESEVNTNPKASAPIDVSYHSSCIYHREQNYSECTFNGAPVNFKLRPCVDAELIDLMMDAYDLAPNPNISSRLGINDFSLSYDILNGTLVDDINYHDLDNVNDHDLDDINNHDLNVINNHDHNIDADCFFPIDDDLNDPYIYPSEIVSGLKLLGLKI